MKNLNIILIALLCTSVIGCGSFRKNLISEADTSNNSDLNKYGSLDVENAEIQIRPMNRLNVASGIMLTFPLPPLYYLDDRDSEDFYHYSSYYEFYKNNPPDYFVVEILVFPKKLPLEVDMSKVALSVGSNRYYPSSLRGPFEIYRGQLFGIKTKRRDFDQLCNLGKELDEPAELNNIVIPNDVRRCFALTYSITPLTPDVGFSIYIESAFSGNKKLEIPAVNFYLDSSYDLSN